jgi:membrane protease YdiL (CAAX protease family)
MSHTRMTIEPQAGTASGRPWGAWTSIAWVVAAMAPQLILVFWIMHLPSLRHSIGPVLDFVLWAISPVVLGIAVLVRRLPVAPYFAWTTPRPSAVLIAVGAALGVGVLVHVLAYEVNGGTEIGAASDAYRQHLATGGTPSRFLLRSKLAYIYAPIVEETVYRSFLWRGLATSRLGNWGAWLPTLVFFVASHIADYALTP